MLLNLFECGSFASHIYECLLSAKNIVYLMIAFVDFMFSKTVIGILSCQAVEKIQWDSVCALPCLEPTLS